MAWLREIPLVWAIVATVAMYGVMICWAWLRPGKFIYAGAPDKKPWRDLRIWATILMAIQILIYATFGI